MLQRPPHQHLRDFLVVLARDFLQDGVVEFAADERAERLHEDAVFSAILNDRPLLAERVKLHLSNQEQKFSSILSLDSHLYLVDNRELESRVEDLLDVLNIATKRYIRANAYVHSLKHALVANSNTS